MTPLLHLRHKPLSFSASLRLSSSSLHPPFVSSSSSSSFILPSPTGSPRARTYARGRCLLNFHDVHAASKWLNLSEHAGSRRRCVVSILLRAREHRGGEERGWLRIALRYANKVTDGTVGAAHQIAACVCLLCMCVCMDLVQYPAIKARICKRMSPREFVLQSGSLLVANVRVTSFQKTAAIRKLRRPLNHNRGIV